MSSDKVCDTDQRSRHIYGGYAYVNRCFLMPLRNDVRHCAFLIVIGREFQNSLGAEYAKLKDSCCMDL